MKYATHIAVFIIGFSIAWGIFYDNPKLLSPVEEMSQEFEFKMDSSQLEKQVIIDSLTALKVIHTVIIKEENIIYRNHAKIRKGGINDVVFDSLLQRSLSGGRSFYGNNADKEVQ